MDKDIFKRGMKGKPHPAVSTLDIAKRIIFLKIPLSLISIVIIILLVFFSAKFFWMDRCPEPEPCPELDCSKCPKMVEFKEVNVTQEVVVEKLVNISYYVCENGSMMKDRQACNSTLPMIEIMHDNKNKFDDVTLAVDEISWEIKDEATYWGKITSVNFTILNEADFNIAPKIGIRVWTDEDSSEVKSLTRDIFIFDTIIEPDSWFKGGFNTDAVSFRGKNVHVKLVLVNQLPDPDDTIVMAEKTFVVE